MKTIGLDTFETDLVHLGPEVFNQWLSGRSGADHTAQELLQAIQTLPEGIAIFDTQERMLFCNEAYQRLSQTPSPQTERVCDIELGPQWLRHISHVLPDGARLALGLDITDLKTEVAAAQAAQANAEQSKQAKSAFLATISHEIRTPMNGVIGMAQLLYQTPLAADQRLYVETIRSSAEALLVIINDLLDYTKLEAHRMVLHPEPVDLERVIHEVMMLMLPRAQEKSLDLLIDYDVFLPTRFLCDPGRMRQIFTNLIGNAIKFTDSGHILTRIVGHNTPDGHYDLHVTVEDSGIGIAPDQLEHIFGEFNQVESGASLKQQGTGLGLSITKALVEQMGGMVWVESHLGEGSVFGFKLTLEAVAEDAFRPTAIALRRVLVVSDRYLNRVILQKQLCQYGLEVTLCASGSEAITLTQSGQLFDVALIDQELPHMSGQMVAGRLRAQNFTAPILICSNAPLELSESEVNGYLQKPVLRSELYNRLYTLSQAAEPPPNRPMRVLVAEDNKTNQLILQMFLGKLDIDLVFAENGREALEYWQIFAPDLIFMDISMPELSGDAAALKLREAEARGAIPPEGPNPTPILALSAHDVGHDSIGPAFDGHIGKPVEKTLLMAALARYCPTEAFFQRGV